MIVLREPTNVSQARHPVIHEDFVELNPKIN